MSVVPAIFLIILFIGLLIATYRDVKTREVPDTLTYGLIVLGLLGGLCRALLFSDLSIFLVHLYGFLIGLAVGVLMFYLRQWGGGDAKLIMGVGAVVGFSLQDFSLFEFIILLIICGAIYGIVYTLWLALITHRKKFIPAFGAFLRTPIAHRLRITLVIIGVAGVIALFFVPVDVKIMIGFILFFLYLILYSWMFTRVVEKSIMVKEYPVGKLTEGDWIIQEVRSGKRVIIKKNNTGVTLEEIAELKKAKIKTVLVKEGIPFVPGFLLAFIVLILLKYAFGEGWLARLFLR